MKDDRYRSFIPRRLLNSNKDRRQARELQPSPQPSARIDEIDGIPIGDYIEVLRNLESSDESAHLQYVGDFGVWHLSIEDAARLIAVDMWFSGSFDDIKEQPEFDGDQHDPRVQQLLAAPIAELETKLNAAVESGRLKTSYGERDFSTEQLIPERTYIEYGYLREWLTERRYEGGEVIEEWLDVENEISAHMCDEIAYLRRVQKQGLDEVERIAYQAMLAKAGQIDDTKPGDLLAALKGLIAENQRLKEKLALTESLNMAKLDRPLTTRGRRTLLTIIAALCCKARIDYNERGAAQRIREVTEQINAPIDDETIAKLIKEIPDALQFRIR